MSSNKKDNEHHQRILLPQMDPELVTREIGDFVIDRVKKARAKGCVIGLSGGVDSTATAAVIQYAFNSYNKDHEDKLELVGYMLPSRLNSDADTLDGERVAKHLGIRYEILPLDRIIDAYSTTNPETDSRPFDRGNMISRIRANVLSTKAATECKIVAGTGNKDEDFRLNYYTLFGDGAVHMSPIGSLSKRLVRQLAAYHRFDGDLVTRESTAGLEKNQTDFKDIGYSYDTGEIVSEGLEQGMSYDVLVKHPQVISSIEKDFEKSRKFSCVDDVVKDIIRRNEGSRFKAEIMHPPAAKVTLYYS